MQFRKRKEGISVLVACQNEEATLALCVISFLDFADEIIIVDNGSTDNSKRISLDLQGKYPEKIKFYDVPQLQDLYQNRQYALSKSSYTWVVRADADFVAYTHSEYAIHHFRNFLLRQKNIWRPLSFGAPLPNLMADFWHTGKERSSIQLGPHDPGRYVPPPITGPTLRVYRVFPGFRFMRLGRWEGTSFNRLLRWRRKELDKPLWMHCNIKSDRNYLFRSERTNWRQLGDFKRYPTLESFVQASIKQKYQTVDIDEAAEIYLQNYVYPFLQRYDPQKFYPYPRLVKDQMDKNCIYKITERDGIFHREFFSTTLTSSMG